MTDRTIVDPSLAGPSTPEATRILGMSVPPGPDATMQAITTVCPVCSASTSPGEMYCQDCGFLFGSAPAGAAPLEDSSELVRFTSADGQEYLLSAGVNTVGRESCDVVIPHPTVSRRHAQVTLENGAVRVEDLGSTNGTRVSGRRLSPGESTPVASGQTVRFGNVELTLAVPGALAVPPSAAVGEPAVAAAPPSDRAEPVAYLVGADGTEHPLFAGVNSIGRRSANQIPLADPFMSGQHAEIRIEEGGIVLVDIGSTNGTFVDGVRVAHHQPIPLADGSAWTMGKTPVTLRLAGGDGDESLPAPEGAGEETGAIEAPEAI